MLSTVDRTVDSRRAVDSSAAVQAVLELAGPPPDHDSSADALKKNQ